MLGKLPEHIVSAIAHEASSYVQKLQFEAWELPVTIEITVRKKEEGEGFEAEFSTIGKTGRTLDIG